MSIATRQPIDIAVAQFEDIVNRGLQSLIDGDPHLRLVATDVPLEEMDTTLGVHEPDVAILNFASLSSPSDLRELHATFPDVRLMVLANNPTAAECRQMIGFGATACLAKNTEARDVLHTIYLASRGMHVLPSAGESSYEPAGPTPLTAREADVLESPRRVGAPTPRSRPRCTWGSRRCAPTRAISTASWASAHGGSCARRSDGRFF